MLREVVKLVAEPRQVRFETRPDGKAREVIGVRAEVMDLLSSRRRAITAKAQKLVSAFAARFGRDPSLLERSRLAQRRRWRPGRRNRTTGRP